MSKTVEFTYSASKWIMGNRDFITEDVIVNVLKDFPESKRMALREKDCSQIVFRRKRRGKFVEVIVWVHEFPSRSLVYKLHCH